MSPGVRVWTLAQYSPRSIEARSLIYSQLAGRKRLQGHWNTQFFRAMSSRSGRIHVLGLGNLGRLFAHQLAIQPEPPLINLLFHRHSLVTEWEQAERRLEITTEGVTASSSNYTIEVIQHSAHPSQKEDIIANLIIATKTLNTVKALSSVRHRLDHTSTIMFTQNGMGTIEEVTNALFPNPSIRPHYLASVTSHGVYTLGPFRSVHAGLANVTIGRGKVSSQAESKSSTPQYLINKVVKCPALVAREVPSDELIRLQLEKLVINAMINPLTVLFSCQNGELFTRDPILELMRHLLSEASQVIQSLPELRNDPDVASRFSTSNLERIVLDVAGKTAKNTSSMLQDVRAGRPTEIDYINGYIVKRGKEQGVDCLMNQKLIEMVKEGRVIKAEEVKSVFEPGSI